MCIVMCGKCMLDYACLSHDNVLVIGFFGGRRRRAEDGGRRAEGGRRRRKADGRGRRTEDFSSHAQCIHASLSVARSINIFCLFLYPH